VIRPRIRVPRTRAEVILIALAMIGSLALLVISIYWWPQLPAIIPTHFGFDGTPNAFGSKNTLWLLPAIQLFIVLFTLVLSRYPWAFNYPVRITQENAVRQYRRGRLLLAGVGAAVAWLFVFIQWQTIEVALGHTTTLGGVFSTAFVVVTLALFPLIMLTIIVLWVTRGK